MKNATVFVVDDDQAMRDSLKWLIESIGVKVETYPTANAFLTCYSPEQNACLVLDVRMPGMSGLELQDHLNRDGILIPIIIITGHGDIPMAVQALKAGALDFIEKPFNDEALLDSIRVALSQNEAQRQCQLQQSVITARMAVLTPREHEVMLRVTQGLANKEIARNLGVSIKTVEAHRARVMEKMEAHSLAALVRMVLAVSEN